MATKTTTTSGRRAGKTTAQKEAIAQANANGQTAAVLSQDGVTIHEPGKPARKVPRTKGQSTAPAAVGSKENGAAARKTGSKSAAKGKGAPKAGKPAGGHAQKPAPAPQQKEKRPVGRPTVYRDEYVDLIVRFFRIDLERQVEVVRPGKDGKPESVTETVVNRFPTIERFADSINVTRQTLHDWATATEGDGATLKHPEFSYAYARARDLQAALLQEGGMGKVYDPRFASLAAKNLIGWREQVEQSVTATVTQATTDELQAIYERGMEKSRQARVDAAARRATEQMQKPDAE